MPTMTMTNKAYHELEQAAQITGAAKDTVLENALSRYLAELQEDDSCGGFHPYPLTLIKRDETRLQYLMRTGRGFAPNWGDF